MVHLLQLHKRIYEPFNDWVDGAAAAIPAKDKVWNSFLRVSQVGKDKALNMLRADTEPLIDIQELPGNFGLFVPRRDLDRKISISRNLVKTFGEDPTDAAVGRLVEATVLHELIHWAWHHDPELKEPLGVDKGTEFEVAAYGGVVAREPLRVFADNAEDADLGDLSRRYESNGNPGAIGNDSTGGWSYGFYQLASAQGAVKAFLDFLGSAGGGNPRYLEARRALIDAGGDAGARSGTETFKQAWRALAAEDAFSQAQHAFIRTQYYEVFVRTLGDQGINIRPRSKALKDVAWSVAVQHGAQNTAVFTRAWASLSEPMRADDRAFINAIYDERSKVAIYFKNSTDNVKRAVAKRFVDERERALAMLT